MTDVPPPAGSAVPPIAPASAGKHSRASFLIGWIPHVHRSAAMLILSWAASFIIMLVGYVFFPALRVHAVLPWHAAIETWLGLFVQLVLVFIWDFYEGWYAQHRNTPVSTLQGDFIGDLITTAVLLCIFGGMLEAHSLRWYFIIPFLGALIDIAVSTSYAINNAAEKPGVGPKIGT